MMLLIDIGNTRMKWATCDGRVLSPQQAQRYAEWSGEDVVNRILAPLPRPQRVLVSNVGGARIGELVRAAIAQHWGMEPEFIVSTAAACGVRNAYPVPGNLGVDRWLSLIAVHAMEQRLTCIVSVGTAMTVDGIDASGQHLGGVIVPGPDLMVSSLLRNTSDIARKAEGGDATDALFADNTFGAIRQGSAHALAALVDRAVETLGARKGDEPSLLLTGGAAFVIEHLVHQRCQAVPDLVLRGLARYGQG